MRITLMKKADQNDKDPLLVQWIEGEGQDSVKHTMAVKVGETIEVEEQLGYELMHKYKGLFSLEGAGDHVAHKTPKGYAHKAAQADVAK